MATAAWPPNPRLETNTWRQRERGSIGVGASSGGLAVSGAVGFALGDEPQAAIRAEAERSESQRRARGVMRATLHHPPTDEEAATAERAIPSAGAAVGDTHEMQKRSTTVSLTTRVDSI